MHGSACAIFRVKRMSICIYGMTYVRQIYEKSTVQLTSVGLAQAHPNNDVFIRNESLFFVSAAATSAFQLEHTPRLLRSVCPGGYQIRIIEYGKILVLVYGEYYGRVYEVSFYFNVQLYMV